MDAIKTEPDSYRELCPTSHSDNQHIDIEGKLEPVLVSFPQMKTVCVCVCNIFTVVFLVMTLTVVIRKVRAKICQWFAVAKNIS
jgi:hypothetical protein